MTVKDKEVNTVDGIFNPADTPPTMPKHQFIGISRFQKYIDVDVMPTDGMPKCMSAFKPLTDEQISIIEYVKKTTDEKLSPLHRKALSVRHNQLYSELVSSGQIDEDGNFIPSQIMAVDKSKFCGGNLKQAYEEFKSYIEIPSDSKKNPFDKDGNFKLDVCAIWRIKASGGGELPKAFGTSAARAGILLETGNDLDGQIAARNTEICKNQFCENPKHKIAMNRERFKNDFETGSGAVGRVDIIHLHTYKRDNMNKSERFFDPFSDKFVTVALKSNAIYIKKYHGGKVPEELVDILIENDIAILADTFSSKYFKECFDKNNRLIDLFETRYANLRKDSPDKEPYRKFINCLRHMDIYVDASLLLRELSPKAESGFIECDGNVKKMFGDDYDKVWRGLNREMKIMNGAS